MQNCQNLLFVMSSIRKMSTFPISFRQVVVTKLSNNFREATEIQTASFPSTIEDNHVVVKNRFCGVNASDVNVANGLGGYNNGAPPPFGVGFEGISEVVALGSNVKHLSVGQPVANMCLGTYSDYQIIPSKFAFPIPDLNPSYLGLMASAMTAELAFTEYGPLKKGQKVLVTAAAGGTGQFAVQLAKLAGCHVIGTCSNDQKAAFLKSIGCDRPINYKKEDLKGVLKTEYKDGIDVIYESVGGEIFDTCFNALALHGQLIVIGAISSYSFDAKLHASSVLPRLPLSLLMRSSSIHGFFLLHFKHKYRESLMRLIQMYGSGQLKVQMDNGKNAPKKFQGLDSVYKAVDYMYSGKNEGKIYIELQDASKY